jgi:protein KRI1
MPRKMKKKADLFEGAAGGAPSASAGQGLSINARFAGAFEERKRKQDLERAAELGLLPRGQGLEEEEEEEEESEDEGEQLDPTLDRQITAVIQAIRARDPKVYEPGVHFFSGGEAGAAAAAAAAPAPLAK